MDQITGPAAAVAIVWIIGSFLRTVVVNIRQQKAAQIQADVQMRLLDRFGSSQELLAYLQTEAGRKYVESATIDRTNPYARILGAFQAGIVLTLVGVAFLTLRRGVDLPDAQSGFLLFGTLGLALGIGFVLSGATAYVLSRSWGLIGERAEARSER